MEQPTCCDPVLAKQATGSRLKNFVIPAKAGIQFLCIGLLCGFILTGCSSSKKAPPNLNMVISVSTDGHYAIATNTNKQAILWNLKDHSYKVIFKDTNIYSAYFIKHTNDFMYQNDKTNEVVVENVDGKVIKTFNPGFPTYGEVLSSNLRNYFGANVELSLYKIDLATNKKTVINQSWCQQDHHGKSYTGPATTDCIDFRGTDQLLQLQFSANQKQLIGANFGTLYIWNVATGKGLQVTKNDTQTVAAISPGGSYVVTGDIEELGYMQSLKDLHKPGYKLQWSNPPDAVTKAYFDNNHGNSQQILALKFIDSQHVLVFYGAFPNLFNFATLHDPLSNTKINPRWNGVVLKPIKYLPLIPNAAADTNSKPNWPLTADQFSRDQAIDTSPSAHILVMSMAAKNGIIVYKYDPKTQTLKREWSGVVKSSWKFW